MTSQVDICNMALGLELGAARIASFEDGTKNAGLMKLAYDPVRRGLLSDHPWTFGIARANLPNSTIAPVFGWSYTYPVPADFVKLVQLGDSWVFYVNACGTPMFAVEGRAILTDQGSPLPVRYVRDVTDTGMFSALFLLALVKSLAIYACEPLTQSASKKQALQQDLQDIVKRAKRSNDIQLPPQRDPPSSWEMALDGFAG